jgi:hydrogenase expression/formation protein HypE
MNPVTQACKPSLPEVGRDSVERVMMAHGNGGEQMNQLILEHVLPPISNPVLAQLTDGAVLPCSTGRIVFSTDSYVVTPLEFPGGDIGRLAVCGTVNDLAVMGATPTALSLGLIIEEGLRFDVLDRIVASIAAAAREAGVPIVTGDTKVIENRGTLTNDSDSGGGMFVNTAGIGELRIEAQLGVARIEVGDAIVINGTLADHGLAVMSRRNGIEFESDLRSDVAPLNHLIQRILTCGADVKFLRDATRGGLAGVLADVSESSNVSIEIDERRIPVSPTARHAAEMLGFDPLTVANEGKIVSVVAGDDAGKVIEVMRSDPLGRDAAMIGRVVAATPSLVELLTLGGGRRIVQRPYGEDLPRIC